MRFALLLFAFRCLHAFQSESVENHTRRLFSNALCEDGSKPVIHYFEVTINIEADTVEVCSLADQIKLGLDINAVLSSQQIGEGGIDDSIIIDAKVCAEPVTSGRRNLLVRTTFTWNGGGGCTGCPFDNSDYRRRDLAYAVYGTTTWFDEVYAPMLKASLTASLLTNVIPLHPKCLGSNPAVTVEVNKVTLSELVSRFKCRSGDLIAFLATMNLNSVVTPDRQCSSCHNIDFSESSDGRKLRNGVDVSNNWKSIGVSVTATGNYLLDFAPLRARIFDTSNTTCIRTTKTQDFGSPNNNCQGGGPGVGDGGIPGQLGENCNPVGNVLVVQDPSRLGLCPVPSDEGGILTFEFDKPVFFQDIGLMDSDESSTRLEITYADEIVELFYFDSFGDNAVQRVIVGKFNVIKVEIIFKPSSGAITEINFCNVCTAKAGHVESKECLVAGNSVINTVQQIDMINFENSNEEEALLGWTSGSINSDEKASFTKFLGLYTRNLNAPFKTFAVPRDAETIFIELDFYEIDNWSSDAGMSIFVDGEEISMRFDMNQNEVEQKGQTTLGILWNSVPINKPKNLGFLPYNDQKHHITMKVPSSSQLFGDGKLRIVLRSGARPNGESYAGWDNIEVSARFKCMGTAAVTPKPSTAPAQVSKGLPTLSPTKTPTKSPTLSSTTLTPMSKSPTKSPTTRAPTKSITTGNPAKSPSLAPTKA